MPLKCCITSFSSYLFQLFGIQDIIFVMDDFDLGHNVFLSLSAPFGRKVHTTTTELKPLCCSDTVQLGHSAAAQCVQGAHARQIIHHKWRYLDAPKLLIR